MADQAGAEPSTDPQADCVAPASAMQWTVHLARRRPGQAAGVVGVMAAGAGAAAVGFQSAFMGGLAAVVLVGSVSDYLFPLRFTLNDEGAEARGPIHRRRMRWDQVRRVSRDDLSVRLSPFPRPSKLDAFRGILLWFDGNADDVMAFIAHHVKAEAAGGSGIPSL